MEYDENVIAMAAPLKVYVACSSKELDRAERVMDKIRKRGGTITFDWTIDVRRCGSKVPDAITGLRCAQDDLGGVRDADVVLVLDSDEPSYGRTIEHGAALVLGKTLVVSGPARGRIWETLEHARVEGDDMAAIDMVFALGSAVARHASSPSPMRALLTSVDICTGDSVTENITLPATEEHTA